MHSFSFYGRQYGALDPFLTSTEQYSTSHRHMCHCLCLIKDIFSFLWHTPGMGSRPLAQSDLTLRYRWLPRTSAWQPVASQPYHTTQISSLTREPWVVYELIIWARIIGQCSKWRLIGDKRLGGGEEWERERAVCHNCMACAHVGWR